MIPDIILEAYDRGLLCTCKQYTKVFDKNGKIVDSYLRHNLTCDGVTKMSIFTERENEVRSK